MWCSRITPYDLSNVLVYRTGGVEVVAGQTIAGAQKIFFAQLADPNHVGLFTGRNSRFFAGRSQQ